MSQSVLLLDPKTELSAKPSANTLVLEPVDGKDIGIAEVRRMIQWAGQTSFETGQKRVVVLQAQKISRDAQHAMLKTLEEPTEQTDIILTVDQVDSVLPTIKSRCAIIEIRHLTSEELKTYGLDTSTINDKRKTKNETVPAYADFIAASDLDRWQIIEGLLKNKGELAEQLAKWQNESAEMIQQAPADQLTTLIHQAKVLDEAISALKSNVLPRLVADKFLLSLA